MTQTAVKPAQETSEIDLRTTLRKFVKHRQTLFSAAILAVGVSMIYSAMATPIFEATSRILVETKPPKILKIENQIVPDQTDSVNFFNSQIEILKSRSLAEIVFKDLGGYQPWDRRGKRAATGKPLQDEERIEELLSRIRIEPIRMTQVIAVSVQDPDPELAARIANSWTRAYMLFSSTDQLAQRKRELEDDLTQQLKFLKQKHPVIVGLRGEIEAIDDKIKAERDSLSRSDNPLIASTDLKNVKVLDEARVPLKPARPRKLVNVAAGLVAGLLLGGILALIFEALDQTIKTPVDLHRFLGLPSLAVLPYCAAGKEFKDLEPALLAAQARRSTAAEAFRSLRTSIVFSSPDRPLKTFLVTSSSPSEGKTTVAVNLATVFAHSGERTLLVDTDLRNPRLHGVLKMERAEGVTDVVALQKKSAADCIRKTEIPGVDLLACGEVPPNPSEIVGSKKMAELVAKLSTLYDRIIFDTPPVLAATDAVVLSNQMDATLLVVKAGDNHRQAVVRTVEALRSAHARLLGGVLNMTDPSEIGAHYYYYMYGEDAKKKPARKR